MNNLNNIKLGSAKRPIVHIFRLVLPLIFMFYVSGVQAIGLASDYTAVPPLIDMSASNDKPNVLMVIDNSNSMDEAANGSAVGSDSQYSKSEIARGALKKIINNFGDSSRLGLMAYKQSGINSRHIHNSPYDASFDPANFDSTYNGSRDSLTKKYRIPNPTNSGAYIYYNIALPFYAGSNQGNAFCRSNTADFDNGSETVGSGPWDNYQCYRNKTTANDNYNSGFSSLIGTYNFRPTDSDYAQDILDFGRYMTWHYVGRTWFSDSSPGKGMLHVNIADVDATQETRLLAKLATSQFSSAIDTPIRNAGLTPIQGTLQSAKSYFQGALPSSERMSGVSGALPAGNVCGNDNDYVVLVTDGLPSVNASGNIITDTTAAITAAAAAAADLLSTQNVKTFVVGFALPNGVDPSVLNQIAVAGGTTNAYLASDETSLNQALGSIFLSIINRTSSSTGAAVLANNTRGEGAVYQASYNPRMEDVDGNSVSWVGGLQGLFIDQLGYLREDTNGNKALDGYATDSIVEYFYDVVENRARIRVFSGSSETIAPDTSAMPSSVKEVSELNVLWQARDELAALTNTTSQRSYSDSAATGRHIVTSSTGTGLTDFVAISPSDLAALTAAEDAALVNLNLAIADVSFATTGLSGAEQTVDDANSELADAQFEADYRQDIVTTLEVFNELEQAEINAYGAAFALRNRELAEQDVIDAQQVYDALIADGAPAASPEVLAALLVLDGKMQDLIDAQAAESAAQANLDTANAALVAAQSAVGSLDANQQLIGNVILAEQALENAYANKVPFQTAYNNSFSDRVAKQVLENTARTNYGNASFTHSNAQSAYDGAVTTASTALTTRDNAVTSAGASQTAYDTANTLVTTAQTAYDNSVTTATPIYNAFTNAGSVRAAARTNYAEVLAIYGDTANPFVVAAQATLDAAELDYTNTNAAWLNAYQNFLDRQGELTAATTARTNANNALDAANLLVTNTNIALNNADQAVIDRNDELGLANTARLETAAILTLAVAETDAAEAIQATALANLTAANNVITDAEVQVTQAQTDQNAYYLKGDIEIDPSDLTGALVDANNNLTIAIEGSGAEDLEGADGLNNKIANAQVAAANLPNAQAALVAANTAKVAAQTAYDNARMTALNSTFLNYLMEVSGTEANKLVNYIRGEEQAGYRSRTIDMDGDGDTEVWRLGDIVHSTPALVGAPASSYDALYNDSTYAVYREQYKNRRQMVYIGANDGMLHAINAGFWNESAKKFELNNSFVSGSSGLTQHPLGSEVWSYVPRSVLPHLKWLKDLGYAHTYYVDGEPITFDANIFPDDADHPFGWGTVLAIGLRFGGGEINVDSDGDTVNDTTTYSSYVLMDVTNPEVPPRLISEISHSELGFTTSKPAVVKKRIPATGTSYDSTTVNSWHLVFGSGPTELSDATSTQNAKLFVYDLVAKSFITGFMPKDITSQANSFVGDISVANWDNDFIDDTAYFGVIGGTPGASVGQVMRYRLDQTSSTAISTFLDTDRVTVGKPLPVVDGNGRKWIYFGTGRLFNGSDNSTTQLQRYYGVMEPVDTVGDMTWAAVSTSNLQDVTDISIFDNGDLTISSGTLEIPTGKTITSYNALKSSLPRYKSGWFRNLYNQSTKPTGRNISSSAKSRSIVFFTEYKPADNACQPEGTSLLYGVDYQTGTAVPFTVFGTDSSVTNNDGELSLSAVDLGQGNSSAPVVIENNSSSRSGSSDSIVSILTQSSTGVLRVDLATVGTYATGRESWMQIELE